MKSKVNGVWFFCHDQITSRETPSKLKKAVDISDDWNNMSALRTNRYGSVGYFVAILVAILGISLKS